jgi:predicted metal-binding membrane protein
VTTPPDSPFAIEHVVRRDRLVVALGLVAVGVVSWAYLGRMAIGMRAAAADRAMHAAMGMPDPAAWDAASLAALFAMWVIMMVAMMLPSAAPTILLVVGVYRRRGRPRARGLTAAFVGGYLLTWTAFSATAALAQGMLHGRALLTPEMASASAWLAGAIFLTAGVYQWLPIKGACLTHCRSPLQFLMRHWRDGTAGALVMGLRHGLFCLGCCWALMLLLFAAGVMNLLWVAAIAAFVLVEKLLPFGHLAGRMAGALLVVWGVYLLSTVL